MAVLAATLLYPVNTTTVDTGTGINVRLLGTAAGTADVTQTATFSNNSNVERYFNPATGGNATATNVATTLTKQGWALRLAQDMTATDDTKGDAYLPAQTITFNLLVNMTQSGGTYASGTVAPTFRASLWRYNPATDTGTLIAAGTGTASWNIAAAGGDLGTAKSVSVPITVPNTVFGAAKGAAAEVLYLQIGFNTGTVPSPTLGTAAFVCTLSVGTTSTSMDMTAGGGLAELYYTTGSASGLGTALASGTKVLPTTGSAAGLGVANASLVAFKLATGSASGLGTAAGAFGAVKLGTGTATGLGTAAGVPSLVKPTVGTVNVAGSGGGTIIVKKVQTVIFDD